MLAYRLCFVSMVLAALAVSPVARAQEGGATVVLDGTLTFEGRATLTIPPGYESLPPPSAPVAPPPVVVAPPPPVVVAPPPPVAPPVAVAPPPVVVAPPPVLEIMAPPANVPPSYAPAPAPAFVLPGTAEIEAPRMRRRWGLVVTGVCIFLGGYGVGLGGGFGMGDTNAWPLIPLVGSLIGMVDDDDNFSRMLMYGISSGLQVAGFIMAIVGTATRRPVRERAPRAEITATPVASDGYVGMAVGGSF